MNISTLRNLALLSFFLAVFLQLEIRAEERYEFDCVNQESCDPETTCCNCEDYPLDQICKLVKFDPNLTFAMTNFYRGVGDGLLLLKEKKRLDNQSIYIGGKFLMGLTYEHTSQEIPSVPANFYTYTHITNGREDDSSGCQALPVGVWVPITYNMNCWVTTYLEFLGGELRYEDRSEFNLDLWKSFVLIGNLDCCPWYFWIGKRDVDFGAFESYNFWSFNLTRAAFGANNSRQAGIGYSSNGLDASLTYLSGERNGWNVYSDDNNFNSNYAANIKYSGECGNLNYRFGAGYINGCGFGVRNVDEDGIPITEIRNGAWDVNFGVKYCDFNLIIEYVQTTKDTPIVALDEIEEGFLQHGGGKASALAVEGIYFFNICDKLSSISASYNFLKDGSGSDSIAYQVALSLAHNPWEMVWFGIEYCYDQNVQGLAIPYRGRAPVSQAIIAGNRDQQNHSVTLVALTFF